MILAVVLFMVMLLLIIGQSSNVDSASQNLASSFVNGLINAGFVRDKLLTTDEGNKWIYKNKTYGNYLYCQCYVLT